MARPTQITDDIIVEALAAGGEVTAADLADRLGMGQSTAAKRLAALEASGAVRRTPGGRVNGVRVADLWSSVATAPVTPDAEPHADADARVPDSGGSDEAPAESSGRLGRGALGTLVRDYLAARPGEAFGPTAVGKALGRSQGAVSNSLASMAAKGEVVLVGDKPRRYRIAS
jgi:DNA-binding transcriptional ArsR family regulator